jgi:hypothetical protein
VTGELDWKRSRSKRLQASLIGALGHPTIWLLGRSWRWRVSGHDILDGVHASGRYPVMAFWHGRILPSIYFFRHRDIVVITSDNFDGEWTAKIIHRFGYTTARGSTSRNAARAALRAKRRMEEGHAVGVTLDGPRGPALVSIVPFHVEARPSWTAPSWDASQIPYPFSRVAVVIGEPIEIPPDADDAVMESKRCELEAHLNALQPRALELLG